MRILVRLVFAWTNLLSAAMALHGINSVRLLRGQPTMESSTRLSAAIKFKNFEEMIDSFPDEPVLLAFTAVNCGPCKLQTSELALFRKMLGGDMRMLAIDTEKWPQVGSRFAVAKLPCLVVLKDRQVILRLEGLTTAEVLAEHARLHQIV